MFAEGAKNGKDIGPGSDGSGGTLNISGDAAVFLKRDSFITPTAPLAHMHETVTGHTAGSSVYGIPVDWSGNFGAFLLLRTLSYDINGGTGTVAASVTQLAGATALVSDGSGLSRAEYTFVGWNTQASGGGYSYNGGDEFVFPMDTDTTLYARWTGNSMPSPIT